MNVYQKSVRLNMNSKTIKPKINNDFQFISYSKENSRPELLDNPKTLNFSHMQNSDENLETVKKIHSILSNCSNLTQEQKWDYCRGERYFMKLFLKKFVRSNFY